MCKYFNFFYPTRACTSRGLFDRGWCPFIYTYVYRYVCDSNKGLNSTLAVDLPFQTLAVDFSSNI